jgi:hypothetical protein
MFWTVICLIVDVAIIGRAKQSWYSEKTVRGYEGAKFFQAGYLFFCNRACMWKGGNSVMSVGSSGGNPD